ncbi:MAG: hypothetical protein JO057_17760 [Chloroflexi bacterium]|nr:hypothetical protein [Chloroflexota bacterium]
MSRSVSCRTWWAPWLGPLAFTVGIFLYLAPRRSFVWLCLVVYAAWCGQQLGGAYLGGFAGALVMSLVAYGLAQVPGAPTLDEDDHRGIR